MGGLIGKGGEVIRRAFWRNLRVVFEGTKAAFCRDLRVCFRGNLEETRETCCRELCVFGEANEIKNKLQGGVYEPR